MKSKIFKSLLAIACLLSSTSVFAYDFEVDGIYYDLVSSTDLTCSVTSGDAEYEGDIVIPATVNYSNRTLTVVEVATHAFEGCSNLTGITIPNTVTSVGNYAFTGCKGLERVRIEDGETVLKLGHGNYQTSKGSFYDCPIQSLYLGRDLSYGVAYSSFQNIATLKELTIGNSVTAIGNYAFYGCSSLAEVKIPDSVTTIGNRAFYNCSSLASVTIGNSVTTIGEYAFNGCSSLSSVTMGKSIKTIYASTFAGCDNLSELYVLNTTPPIIGSNYFTNKHYITVNVYVPQEALEAYQNANIWKNFWNLQGFDVTGIGDVKLGGEKGDAVYYDLSGRRLNTPRRGLNIVNGRKVMVQ